VLAAGFDRVIGPGLDQLADADAEIAQQADYQLVAL